MTGPRKAPVLAICIRSSCPQPSLRDECGTCATMAGKLPGRESDDSSQAYEFFQNI